MFAHLSLHPSETVQIQVECLEVNKERERETEFMLEVRMYVSGALLQQTKESLITRRPTRYSLEATQTGQEDSSPPTSQVPTAAVLPLEDMEAPLPPNHGQSPRKSLVGSDQRSKQLPRYTASEYGGSISKHYGQ